MLFKNKRFNREKILDNGFTQYAENFIRHEKFLKDLTLTIIIDTLGNVTTKIIDANGELYNLHLVESASGSFVGAVREELTRILNKVAKDCFDDLIFSFEQTVRIVDYIRENFFVEPEFLWKNFPSDAIFRHPDNQKWFAVIMNIPYEKLNLIYSGNLEILNLRVEPSELDTIFDGEKYFRGWHMNKRSWMTLRLDDTLQDNEIFSRISTSYNLVYGK